MQAKIKNNWIVCGRCNHKLARLPDNWESCKIDLEIKCSSCKILNEVKINITEAHDDKFISNE